MGSPASPLAAPAHYAVEAYAAAKRLLGPRCGSLACSGPSEWSGALRVFAIGAAPPAPPIVEVRFPHVCSPCSLQHVHNHIAGDAFWALVENLARAGLLPPPDRASMESEFTSL